MKRGKHQDKSGFQCADVWHRQVLMAAESDIGSKFTHFLTQSEPISGSFIPSGRKPILEHIPPVLQKIHCWDFPGRMPQAG